MAQQSYEARRDLEERMASQSKHVQLTPEQEVERQRRHREINKMVKESLMKQGFIKEAEKIRV